MEAIGRHGPEFFHLVNIFGHSGTSVPASLHDIICDLSPSSQVSFPVPFSQLLSCLCKPSPQCNSVSFEMHGPTFFQRPNIFGQSAHAVPASIHDISLFVSVMLHISEPVPFPHPLSCFFEIIMN